MVNPKPTAGKRTAPPKKAAPSKAAGSKKGKAPAPAKGKATAKKAPGTATAKATAKAARGSAKKAPVRKAPARKAPVKKAPAKKAPAPKPAPSPKKAAAKAAPVKKQATAKAPAKEKATAKATAKGKAAAATEAQAATEEAPARVPFVAKVPPRKPGSVICPLSGWEVMPAKPGLSERTLKRLQQRLLEEREQQLRQADDLAAEAEELAQERDPGDTQFDEESGEGDTINVERERDLLLSATARGIVDSIDRALARMDAGTYGLCIPAGRKLSLERLEAIPYAEECVDCKARAERRR
jgi:RNA polymerase-binding transcription factor DksA